jgi:hypothetical protein
MAKYMSAIVDDVRRNVMDDYEDSQSEDFSDDDIKRAVLDTLVRLSEVSPYMVKETLTTTAGSKELDISDVESLIAIQEIEYPVDREPRILRGWSDRETGKVILDIDYDPSGSESVYVYCRKVHTLDYKTSTLNPQQERILIMGAEAKLILQWTHTIRGYIVAAKEVLESASDKIDDTSARLAQAITDLASSRSYVNKLNVAGKPQSDLTSIAGRELQVASNSINTAQGYMREMQSNLSISSAIRVYENKANLELERFEHELKKIRIPRTFKTYSRS